MTSDFDSFNEGPGGDFTESPLGARNAGGGPIWLATRFDEGVQPGGVQARGRIYEIHPETLEPLRWGVAPTPLVEGIGGDRDVIWYVDNKWHETPEDTPPTLFELSPHGWFNGEDVPVVRRWQYPSSNLFITGIGGDVDIIWIFVEFRPHDFRIAEVNPRTLFIGGLQVAVPFEFTSGCGGSSHVVYVCGNSPNASVSNLVSKFGRNLQTFRGGRLLPSPDEQGFIAVGGSVDAIWALGVPGVNPFIYDIDPDNIDPATGTYAIRNRNDLAFLNAERIEGAYAIGGK